MNICFFSSRPHDEEFFRAANARNRFSLTFRPEHLNPDTALLAKDSDAVCAFVNDDLSRTTLETLGKLGVRSIALRCAGFNNVDLDAAREIGLPVVRVPAYSPHAVAEHALALMLTLNRRTHRAFNRVREGNFSLDGLLGFDMYGRTVGIIGTGRIGKVLANILLGMGCTVLGFDPEPDSELQARGNFRYTGFDELLENSDIISLHCPLTPETQHLIAAGTIGKMRAGVMLINTSRGDIIDTPAVIDGLKSGRIGYLGLDVYEEEGDLFFEDLSGTVIHDDVFMRLTTFPNVLITGHQGFFTRDALKAIAETTLDNLACLQRDGNCSNRLA